MEEFAVNYSRGMKKKLALVCATLHQPKLLILDEPTSGLDPRATRRLNDLLRAWRDAGTTIILSSHLLDQVERLADRMAIVDGGKLAAVGTLAELKQSAQADGSLEDVFFSVTADRAGSG
jgi:ABC-2 type transport system ATP-binding protein